MPIPEHLQSAESLARSAIRDYFSCGPEPNFGELEVSALNEWVDIAETGRNSLKSEDLANLGWMYVDRSWSRSTEAGTLGETPDDSTAEAILADLENAKELFTIARHHADNMLRTHLDSARHGLPMTKLILTDPDSRINPRAMADYIYALMGSNALLYEKFVQTRRQHDIPALDAMLGLRFLTAAFLNTPHIPLVAALRHSRSGAPADRWHTLLFDREKTRAHKIRIAPYGPPDKILLPPAVFGHDTVPSTHGRGMLEAVVSTTAWNHFARTRRAVGGLEKAPAKLVAMQAKIDEADARIEIHLQAELARVENPPQAHEPPDDCLAWYDDLSPYADPCHESHGGALDLAISQLEMVRAEDNSTPELNYRLGWMYMESGMSQQAQATTQAGVLIGAFERAEDIFRETRLGLPQTSQRYFELAVAEAAAPMYRALIAGEGVDEALDIYCGQLAILAPQMLEAYAGITDKTSNEATALFMLIQQVTAYLAVSHAPLRAYIALPAAPRQRGTPENRGWDLTMWLYDSPDSYYQGQFFGRLDTPDPTSIDNGIYTVLPRQLTNTHCKALHSLVSIVDPSAGGKPDHTLVKKLRKELLKIACD